MGREITKNISDIKRESEGYPKMSEQFMKYLSLALYQHVTNTQKHTEIFNKFRFEQLRDKFDPANDGSLDIIKRRHLRAKYKIDERASPEQEWASIGRALADKYEYGTKQIKGRTAPQQRRKAVNEIQDYLRDVSKHPQIKENIGELAYNELRDASVASIISGIYKGMCREGRDGDFFRAFAIAYQIISPPQLFTDPIAPNAKIKVKRGIESSVSRGKKSDT